MASSGTIYNRTGMTHQSQLEQRKYRNWVKAGLGLKYVKEGLETFCDDIVKQIHIDIIGKVGAQVRTPVIVCGNCDMRTLMPNHVQTKFKLCPLGHMYCSCQRPQGKVSCPNNVCGKIMDEIIVRHASTPPAPHWKNTDVSRWCTDPWAIALCYINAPGYQQKNNAYETDTNGLLHLIINNLGFRNHIQCVITGTDIFNKVRQIRNVIMHKHTMEIEDVETFSYINDMIALLQDGKELIHRRESQEAVQKLIQLKQEDFIITTRSEAEVVRDIMLAITLKEQELRETIEDAHFTIDMKRAEFRSEVEMRLKELDERLNARTDVLAESEDRRVAVNNDVVGTSNNEAGTSDPRVAIDNRSINNAQVHVSSESRTCILFNNSPLQGCTVNIYQQNQ